jgi:hypothetical protein
MTLRDDTDAIAYGGDQVAYDTGFYLVPGNPGSTVILEEPESHAALWFIADSGKTPAYQLSWISANEERRKG